MAIATYTDYKNRLTNNNRQYIPFTLSFNSSTVRAHCALLSILPAYTAPDVAPGSAPTNTTNGFFTYNNPSGSTMHVIGAEFDTILPLSLNLIDVLSYSSGYSGTITGLQGTSTAALTRYTNGVGVRVGILIYAVIGTTATTLTYNYTNSSDVTNRQAPLIPIGGTNFREAGRFLELPLINDDVGIKSIQSYQLTATTGTAGSYGFVLYKSLCTFSVHTGRGTQHCNLINGSMSNIAEIVPNSALTFLITSNSNSSVGTNIISGRLILSES